MARQEEALAVAREIVETEAKLARLQERFAALVQSDGAVRRKKPDSVPTRVIGVMAAHPERIFRIDEIKEALPDVDLILLRNTVLRMGKTKRLVKCARGQYSLKGARAQSTEVSAEN